MVLQNSAGSRVIRKAVSFPVAVALLVIIVIVIAGVAGIAYNFGSSSANQPALNSLQSQVAVLQGEANNAQANISALQAKLATLPVMNQKPQVRNIKVEWVNSLNSGQDRFFLPAITVDQGDRIAITFVSNDTDAHTFTLESPYYFQINATVPGTRDFLNGAIFTTNGTNNSPGVKVLGTPGNVTGTGSFVARYPGIYEYFCIYHVAIGMFGYFIVLPNAGYTSSGNLTSSTVTGPAGQGTHISIVSGAGANPNSTGFTPNFVTVVLGVNSTVVWSNNDTVPHTVTADDGSFSSGNLNPGDSYTLTFDKAGNYSYHCSYHPWMKGTIIVLKS